MTIASLVENIVSNEIDMKIIKRMTRKKENLSLDYVEGVMISQEHKFL